MKKINRPPPGPKWKNWNPGWPWLGKQKVLEPGPEFSGRGDGRECGNQEPAEGEQRDEPETRQARARLLPVANIGWSSLFHPDGPLWFRGFNGWGDEEGPDLVAKVLKQLRGQRVVSGHSVQQTRRITERFGGRVFLIDTGMLGEPFFPNGRASALEISGGAARPIYLD